MTQFYLTMKKPFNIIIALCLTTPAVAIDIVGSSTVYPFSTVAAELFAQETEQKTPKIEATGSGGGMKLFCAGNGDNTPDITNASRRIKKSEQQLCAANGVSAILEIKIGYDGIVIANSLNGVAMPLTRQQLFLALAREIPDSSGNLVANFHQTWQSINAALPAIKIRVYGPPPTSGTRDAFAELVMEKGCVTFPQLKALKKSDSKKFNAACHSIREDGAYIESGENDNLIIQKLKTNPESLGIFGFSFLEENRDKTRGLTIDGVAPEYDAIADNSYPVSRPLFFYVKLAHYGKTKGLKEFVEFFVSEDIMGEDGELIERGLIALPPDEYQAILSDVQKQTPISDL